MSKYSKFILSAAATAVAAPLALAAPANAAAGDQFVTNGDFQTATTATTLQSLGFETDFTQAQDRQGSNADAGNGETMWDPGMYILGTNPRSYHPFWVDEPGADPQLIVNGAETEDQTVLEKTVYPTGCEFGEQITFDFSAKAHNILPLDQISTGGAEVSVEVNGNVIGSEKVLSNDPSNVVQIVGNVPWSAGGMNIRLINNGTAYSGNDFAIDNVSLTQVGECEPPCVPEVKNVWHNYTGNFAKNGKDTDHNGVPDLDDPLWHAVPAQPGGQHAFSLRGYTPYQPGVDKGKGDWFVWKDLGRTCTTPA